MNDTFIKLYRGLLDWEWFKDSNMVHLYVYLLIKANYTDSRFQGHEVKRGQLITGRKSLSEATSISQRTIRTCLNKLISTNEITMQSTNSFSIITIVKYEDYQCFEKKSTNKTSNERPASDQQVTTSKEGNKAIKIIFQKSNIFDKAEFIKVFPDWTKEKLAYYYEAAVRYSDEGNKYVRWDSAIKAWAKKDELLGKINFNKPKNIQESGQL